MVGLYVILLAILVAVFAYWHRTRPSPNANRMILEISGETSRLTRKFLKVKKENAIKVGLLERTISGKR